MTDFCYIINHTAGEYYYEDLAIPHNKMREMFIEGRWLFTDNVKISDKLIPDVKTIYNQVVF